MSSLSPSEHQSQDKALTSTQPQGPAAVGSEQDDVPRGTSLCNTSGLRIGSIHTRALGTLQHVHTIKAIRWFPNGWGQLHNLTFGGQTLIFLHLSLAPNRRDQ